MLNLRILPDESKSVQRASNRQPAGEHIKKIEPEPCWIDIFLSTQTTEAERYDFLKDQLKSIFNLVPSGVSICMDVKCREIRHNPAASAYLEIGPWEISSHSGLHIPNYQVLSAGKVLRPEELPIQRATWFGEETHEQELEFVWPDGRRKFALYHADPLRNSEGRIIGAIATFEDITARKLMEQTLMRSYTDLESRVRDRTVELLEAKQRLNDILESITDGLFMLDSNWCFTFLNRQADALHADKMAELIGQCIWDVFPMLNGSELEMACRRAMRDQKPIYLETWFSTNGSWQAFTLYPTHSTLLIYCRDITERKAMESKIEQTEELFAVSFESLLDGCGICDAVRDENGRIVDFIVRYVNQAGSDLLGLPKEVQIGSLISDLFPFMLKRLFADACQVIEDGKPLIKEVVLGGDSSTDPIDGAYDVQLVKLGDGLLCSAREITERKRAEERLKLSEERFLKAFHCSPALMSIKTNHEGRYLDVNDNWLRVFGYTREEVIGKTANDLNIWSDSTQSKWFLGLEGITRIHQVEVQLKNKNGDSLIFIGSTEAIELNGEICLLTALTEITDRKRMENDLHASRAETIEILESISDAFVALDSDLRFTYLNQAALRLVNRSADKLIGQGLPDLYPAIDPEIIQVLNSVLWDKKPRQIDLAPGVFSKWYEINVYPKNDGISVYLCNIQERKEAEKQFRDNTERMKALLKLNQMSHATRQEITDYVFDQGMRLTGSATGFFGLICPNDHCLDTTFYVKSDAGSDGFEARHMPLRIEGTALWAGCVQKRQPIIVNDVPADMAFRLPNKHIEINRFLGVPVFEDNRVVGVAVAANKPTPYDESDLHQLRLLINGMWEIVKRREAEEALRQSEERFFNAFHANPMMMVILDMEENRFIEANQKFLDIMEIDRNEVIGRTPVELRFWPEHLDVEPYRQRLESEHHLDQMEWTLTSRSGQSYTVLTSIQLITLNGRKCRVTGMQDVTEKKQLEENISRLARLNLIGQMAASIGHEIRNPMTAVRGFLQMMRQKEDTHQYHAYYDIMIEELDRANRIITDYLNIASDKRVNLKPHALDAVIQTIFPLLEAEAHYLDMMIQLDLNLPSVVMIDEKEIRQLIMNLTRNGLEAMKPGGTLRISTRIEDDRAVLILQDEGPGFAQGLLDQLGTPFITTKESGTGLGLAVCYSIAARHQAVIKVESSPNGTRISVSFPLLQVEDWTGPALS
ncbi:MAG: PAS domain S-box protein [Solirubrobacterales bacterium]